MKDLNSLSMMSKSRHSFLCTQRRYGLFVYPILEGIVEQENIYCNHASFKEDHIQIEWPHACDSECQNGCGCCKPSIIRELTQEDDFIIMIGDSVTDIEAAKHADLTFARDYLLNECKELGSYIKSMKHLLI